MKRTISAILLVFVIWSFMDFEIHGVILEPAYAATPHLWRPMAEMKIELMYLTVFVAAASFVLIYAWLIPDRSVKKGIQYGFLFGIGSGISMGYGSYSVMPLPDTLALGWFLGTLAECVIAGWIIGIIVRKRRENINWKPFGIRERGDYIR